MTIYDLELASYRQELRRLVADGDAVRVAETVREGTSLTHYALGLSNRGNMILVGLCGLVEALLSDIALTEEAKSPFRLEEIRGVGRKRIQLFLTRIGAIDFKVLPSWPEFERLYRIRNSIVHGHGGLVSSGSLSKVKNALKSLNMQEILVGDRRIRMNEASLRSAHTIVSNVVREIQRLHSS